MTLLLLTAAAHAHSSALPHVHSPDPLTPWIVVAWTLAAVGWAVWALRSPSKRGAPSEAM